MNLPLIPFAPDLLHCPGMGEAQRMAIPAAPHPEVLMLRSRQAVVAAFAQGRIDVPREYGTTWNCERDGRDMLRMSGPKLTRIHQIIGPITAQNSSSELAAIRRRARKLARQLDSSAGPVDIITQYVEPFIGAEVARDMGVPSDEWDTRIYGPTNIVLGLRESDAARDAILAEWSGIYDYCHPLVEQRRRNPDQSAVSRAVSAMHKAGFSDREIGHVIATFLTGYPTPVPVLSTCIAELLSEPDALSACRRSRGLYALTLRETIRRSANFAYGSPRLITDELRLKPPGGPELTIAAGTVVVPNVRRALNDPAEVDEPETFNPTRPGVSKFSLAYGTGPHRCPFVWRSFHWMLIGLEEFCQAHPRARLAHAGEPVRGLLALPSGYWVTGLGTGPRAGRPPRLPQLSGSR
jgi:cytochrome P450